MAALIPLNTRKEQNPFQPENHTNMKRKTNIVIPDGAVPKVDQHTKMRLATLASLAEPKTTILVVYMILSVIK